MVAGGHVMQLRALTCRSSTPSIVSKVMKVGAVLRLCCLIHAFLEGSSSSFKTKVVAFRPFILR